MTEKASADELKKLNTRSHAQIFSKIFAISNVEPQFYLDPACREWARAELPRAPRLDGINVYSGGRWPSKELRPAELQQSIDRILDNASPFGPGAAIVLLGAGVSLALQNGVSREEIIEVITHLAFYSGWPTASSAVTIARRVFEEVGV